MADWVVLELTPQGEDEDPEVLRASVSRVLRGSEIYVPASISVVGDSRITHKLIDNYIFVRRDQPDAYYYRVEGSKYIASVLTVLNGRVRRVSTVRDEHIEKMRRQIQVETDQGIEVGDEVEIMSGAYKAIRGRVIEEILEKDSVQVFIALRSKQAIITLPRSFLRFVTHDDEGAAQAFSPFRTKYLRITEWFRRAASPLSAVVPSIYPVEAQYTNVAKLHPWVVSVEDLVLDVTYRRKVASTPFDSFDDIEARADTMMLLYRTHQTMREVELAPLVLEPAPLVEVGAQASLVGTLAGLALPFSTLDLQIVAGDHLEQWVEPSGFEELQSLQRRLEVYDASAEAIKRLRYQIGQVESKLKKAEQEDVKDRKRLATKHRR